MRTVLLNEYSSAIHVYWPFDPAIMIAPGTVIVGATYTQSECLRKNRFSELYASTCRSPSDSFHQGFGYPSCGYAAVCRAKPQPLPHKAYALDLTDAKLVPADHFLVDCFLFSLCPYTVNRFDPWEHKKTD